MTDPTDLLDRIRTRGWYRHKAARRWNALRIATPIVGAAAAIIGSASAALGAGPSASAFWGGITVGSIALITLLPMRQHQDRALRESWELADFADEVEQSLMGRKTENVKQKILRDHTATWRQMERELPLTGTGSTLLGTVDRLMTIHPDDSDEFTETLPDKPRPPKRASKKAASSPNPATTESAAQSDK